MAENVCLDRERIKDFSGILMDMSTRQDLLSECLYKSEQTIQELRSEVAKGKERITSLSEEVAGLRRIVGLNNVLIALKRDRNGEFEPIAINKIVEEILKKVNNRKRTHSSQVKDGEKDQ